MVSGSTLVLLCLGFAAAQEFEFPDVCATETSWEVVSGGATSGAVDYPEGGGNYPPNARVCWHIQCAAQPYLQVRMTRMDTESGYDFLELQRVGETSPLVRAAGSDLPDDVMVVNASVLVYFASDGSVQRTGFAFEWECLTARPTVAPTPVPTPEPTLAPTPIPTAVPVPTHEVVCVEASVAQYADDAEQAGPRVNYDSQRLDLGRSQGMDQDVGVRFAVVPVPQGAQVVSAEVKFVASSTSSDLPAVLDVAFELVNNSAPFRAHHDVASRDRTSGMEWRVEQAWVGGEEYATPDLSQELQEVLDQEEFTSGNAVTVLIRVGDGHEGTRYARSSDAGRGPQLRVCYLGELGTAAPAPPAGTANPAHCGPRVRRAYSTLTCAERQFFADAVNTFVTTRPELYWGIVDTHITQQLFAHSTSAFLPWHRQYVLQYENMLRSLPGFECVTVPYWDWERDAADEFLAAPMKATTFGSFENHPPRTWQCINSGIAEGWQKRNGDCIARRRSTSSQFTGEAALAALVVNWEDWQNFAARLEGAPHAAPHNYVSGDMSSMGSPFDPLFFMHHANVDRLWAVWQDYYGYDKVAKQSLSNLHYAPSVRGRSRGRISLDEVSIDAPMRYWSNTSGFPLKMFEKDVTPRDMWNIRDMPDGVSYEYGPDNLADQLGDAQEGEWDWMVPASSDRRTCCGDGTTDPNEQCDDGNTIDDDGCTNLCRLARSATTQSSEAAMDATKTGAYTLPDARFTKGKTQAKYEQLQRHQKSKREMLTNLALFECSLLKHRDVASPQWKEMVWMPKEFYDQCQFFV
eukprot:TRINITY_DN14_c0_g2_i1.p1 TRINITY_DN14_c0_g2~~TRINITY_DN14_c0_g2_i1.p1  ORF type:complete len:802 (+),score=268.43 TRINITY_DN14_c0_g2_i1:102-2507(+)